MRKAVFLIFLYLLPVFGITILWDRNSETNVAGYKIYQGTNSRGYYLTLDVGNGISGVVPEIPFVTNYLAVTAYDTDGLESGFSLEVTYFNPSNNIPVDPPIDPPIDPPNTNAASQVQLNIRKGLYGVEIYFDAKANVYYTVEITTNFINWEGYLTTSRSTDTQIIIPWPTWGDKAFFRVSY